MLFTRTRKPATVSVPSQRERSPYESQIVSFMQTAENGRRDDIAQHIADSIAPVLVAKATGSREEFNHAFNGFLDARHDIMKVYGLNADQFNELVDYGMSRIEQPGELMTTTDPRAHE